MKNKKTIVLGASTNPSRYSYKAMHALKSHGVEAIPVGIKKGEVAEEPIIDTSTSHEEVETVTLYVGPHNQASYYDYIINQQPKRVIFNPGTYNPELIKKLKKENIEVVEACTLVMLATGQY